MPTIDILRLASINVERGFRWRWRRPPAMLAATLALSAGRRGRPATGQDPVVTFRLGVEYTKAIDNWRCTERDKPFRSEAIRWLIGQGLEVELKKREKRDCAAALSPKEAPT